MHENPHPTRRDFVKIVGAGAAGAVLGGVSEPASASTDVIADHKPEYVSMYYDDKLSKIQKYQPRMRTAHLKVAPESQYAVYMTSNDDADETDAIQYWTYYPTQRGVSRWDSHYGDREPVVVFLKDGEIDRVVYSGWHYLAVRDYAPPLHDSTHPHYTVANPWHHYYREPTGGTGGEYAPLSDFRDIVNPWYANDWSADPKVVLNPWELQRRESWWDPSSRWGVNINEQRAELALTITRAKPWETANSDI